MEELTLIEEQICQKCGQPKPPRTEHVCGDCVNPIRVIEILNPFQPVDSRKETLLYWETPRPLPELLEAVGRKPEDCMISLGCGEILGPDDFPMALAVPGACITLAPRVAGGGIFRTLAIIAVIAAAIVLPFALAAFTSLSAAAISAITAAVAIGGNLLISMFLAPSLTGTKNTGDTYDPTGPKTIVKPGTVIPKAYGVFQWGGCVISSFVDQEGSDDYLNCLVCYGFGPATTFGEIQLNGKDISSYSNVTVQTRLGTNNQAIIQGFDKIVNGFPQEIRLLAANGFVTVFGTGTNIQALEVTVKFPSGLIRYDDSGNPKELSLSYQVQYSPHGQSNWKNIISPRTTADIVTHHSNGSITYPFWAVIPTDQFMGSGIVYSTDSNQGAHTPGEQWSATQTVTFYDPSNNSSSGSLFLQGEWQPVNPNLNQQSVTDWWGGYRVVSAMQTDPFYDTIKIYGLTAGQWDIRILKYGSAPHTHTITPGDNTDPHYQQDVWLWNVNEVFFRDFSYPNMVLVAVRALATNQLSGTDLNVLTTVTHDIGATLPPQLQSFEHDNPAIVAYDVVMNPLYGAGQLTGYSIDLPAWVAWANFNDEQIPDMNGSMIRRHVFAGVFDATGDVWTALQKIATMSRAIIMPVGTTLTVVIDQPVTNPVQIFTPGNTKRDSFKESWLAIDDRATSIEVEFADALRNYRTDLPVTAVPISGVQPGQVAKTTRVSLFGCTDRSRAWNWAFHKLLENQNLLRSAEIQAAIEAVACRVGSVIGVSSDVTQWGVGGRILPGSTARSINIDRADLPGFATGAGWSLCVLHPVLLRGAATINSIAGSNITLNAAPAGRIVKLVTPDGQTETKVTNQNGNVLTVANTTGFANGQTVSCYDQDAVETQLVSAIAPNDATRVQTAGGSQSLKCYIDAGRSAAGVQYIGRVWVKNQGAHSVFVEDNFGDVSPAILPGQAFQVSLIWIGNGSLDLILYFAGSSTGDALDLIVWDPYIARTVDGINLATAPDFASMGPQAGAVVTLTQNQPEPLLQPNTQRVIVASAFSQAPVSDAPWVYGQSNGSCPAKWFRVQTIKQAGDFEFTLGMIEYSASVYNDSPAVIGNYLGVPDSNAAVSNLSVTETYQFAGQAGAATSKSSQQSRISVSWQNGPDTVGADIYTQTDGSVWRFQGDSGGASSFSFYGTSGDAITIMVVGYDKSGIFAPFATAPQITITVQGASNAPADVSGLQILQATQVQTSGGTNLFKVGIPGGLGASGQSYLVSGAVLNQGTQPITISDNYGHFSPPILPGQAAWVSLNPVGNGSVGLAFWLVANSIGDSINAVIFNPVIAPSGGSNMLTAQQSIWQGATAFQGALVTVTQGGMPGLGIPPALTWNLPAPSADHFELRYSPFADQPWEDCSVIATNIFFSANAWIIPDVIGYYYLVAWGSNGVRSIHPASAYWANLPGNVGVGSGGPGPGGGLPPRIVPGPRGVLPSLTLTAMHSSLSELAGGMSTPLNSQGSVLPVPDIPASVSSSNSSGVCTITVTWASKVQPLPDGSSVTVQAGSATWTGLAASTTYYLYRYISLLNDAMTFVIPPGNTAPDTSPNPSNSSATVADSRIGLSPITATTPASSGGGGSGGNPPCPDGQEKVRSKERGEVTVYSVYEHLERGIAQHVEGKNLKTGQPEWRKVIAAEVCHSTTWYVVAGHKISPHHECWRDGDWKMPYRIGRFLAEHGIRVKLTLEEDDFDSQNYVLCGEEELIIHNWIPAGS